MLEHVRALAEEIGPRSAGSSAEEKAAAYVAEQFHEAGLVDVAIEPVDVVGFDYSRCHLNCPGLDPSLKLSAHPGRFSGSTDGLVEWPLRYVDTLDVLSPEEHEGTAVAFWDGLTVEQYRRALEVGAAGLLLIPSAKAPTHHVRQMGYPFQCSTPFEVLEESKQLPMVSVAYWDIARALQAGADRVVLDVDGETAGKTGHNVVGRLVGEDGARRVVICAHHDTVAGSPGASDNAAGVAVMIELARRLVTDRPGVHVDFVSFTGEEVGYLGAHAYVEGHAGDLAGTDLVLYVDGQGDRVGRTVYNVTGDDALEAFTGQVVEDLRQPGQVQRYVGGLDHSVLMAAHRMPGVWMQRLPQLFWHTGYDRVDALDERPMREGVDVYAEIVRRMASVPGEPFAPRLNDRHIERMASYARKRHAALETLLARA
jgi:aminopeptidase YwaD